MQLSESDLEALQRLEAELWRAETRFDRAHMEKLIAQDFLEFGRSGRVYRRDDMLSVAPEPFEACLPLQDFHIRLIAPDVAQVTYNSAVKYDGVYEYGRRSSIWSRTPDGWILRFHQGTPYEGDA